MKLSNFKLLAPNLATVEVTTTVGMLWWKKTHTEVKRLYKKSRYWCFVDTGEFTPGYEAEFLETVAMAQKAWEEKFPKTSDDE